MVFLFFTSMHREIDFSFFFFFFYAHTCVLICFRHVSLIGFVYGILTKDLSLLLI